MPYETILTDTSEAIFTITINRPDKLNALNTHDDPRADRRVRQGGRGRRGARDHRDRSGPGVLRRRRPLERRPHIRPRGARGPPPVPNGPDGKPDLAHDSARRRRAHHAAHLRLPQAGDRRRERPGGRHRRHDAAADGRPHRVERRRASASCSRSAASCRRRHRAISCRASSASRRRSTGAIRAASSARTRRSPADWSAAWWRRTSSCRRRARSRARYRRQHLAGVGRADPPDDVAHARRRATRWRRTGSTAAPCSIAAAAPT